MLMTPTRLRQLTSPDMQLCRVLRHHRSCMGSHAPNPSLSAYQDARGPRPSSMEAVCAAPTWPSGQVALHQHRMLTLLQPCFYSLAHLWLNKVRSKAFCHCEIGLPGCAS